jgi:predicted MFS family arabinose efflux permease
MDVEATGNGPRTLRRATHRRPVPAGVAVFVCLFASQAGLMSLTPVLARVAEDFGVTTADAGQLRTLAGLVAGVTCLAIAALGGRFGLRTLLSTGLVLLALGSLGSAFAPGIGVLAVAQCATGTAVALLLSGGTAAASEWAAPGKSSRLLSCALVGQAAAWVVGMPAIGALGEADWRLALVVPLAAGVAAAAAIRLGPDSSTRNPVPGGVRALFREREVRRWALGELLAFSAWTGTLVYGGALFVETYGLSAGVTGLVLAGCGAAYFPGSLLARRIADRHARRLLVGLGLAAAVSIALLGAVRTSLWQSVALFALLGVLGGARILAGSTLGVALASDRKLAVMSVRAAVVQFGYLAGAGLGGAALAFGGYAALGWTFAALFLAGTAPHALAARARRTREELPVGTRQSTPARAAGDVWNTSEQIHPDRDNGAGGGAHLEPPPRRARSAGRDRWATAAP